MSKIMVVDDNPDIIRLVKIILKKEGHEVVGAGGGVEALKKLPEVMPDLVLLDIMMPELDGWETLRLIKESEMLKDIPVAMLTAKNITEALYIEDVEHLADYITKPFTHASLVGKVDEILKNLEQLKREKSEMEKQRLDNDLIKEYESAYKAVMLHESLLLTLCEDFKKAENPFEAGIIKEGILMQERLLEANSVKSKEIQRIIEERDLTSSGLIYSEIET